MLLLQWASSALAVGLGKFEDNIRVLGPPEYSLMDCGDAMSSAKPQLSPSTTATSARTVLPEWMRVAEACAYSRLSKPKLYQLLNAGRIKTVSLKERGQVRGTRLISSDSLRAFLESRSTGGESTPSA
jgi:excisionase family DNA binding protein